MRIAGEGRRTAMTANRMNALKALEGRRVGLAVRGGQRIDDCQLVSTGRGRARTVWVFADGTDSFFSVDEIVDLWEAA